MFQAVCLGKFASLHMSTNQPLKLMGKTSRGIFLQTADGWTIFLTEEPPHGPITINLPPGSLASIAEDLPKSVDVTRGILSFSPAVQISVRQASVWSTPPPSPRIQPASIRRQTITKAISHIMQNKPDISGVLPDVMTLFSIPSHATLMDGPFHNNLYELKQAIHLQEKPALQQALTAFLGQGSGLTPSGDDFLLGFFFTLRRWENHLPLAKIALQEARPILLAAQSKTTGLSANLIECAQSGEADQRLVPCLDEMMNAAQCSQKSIDSILSWGSSSGLDALAGMIFASLTEEFFTS